jgi:hypothetical protein
MHVLSHDRCIALVLHLTLFLSAVVYAAVTYCNVDDEALLGNDTVKQYKKGSDHCYAMARYTGVNNGVKDVFFVVGAAVIQQSDNSSEISAVQNSSECSSSLV